MVMKILKTNFETIKSSMELNVQRNLAVYFGNANHEYYAMYLSKDDNTYILGGSKYILQKTTGLLKLLKKDNINNILIDIKNYDASVLNKQFINRESMLKAIEFKEKYISTNGSNMTLLQLNLKKVKLSELT